MWYLTCEYILLRDSFQYDWELAKTIIVDLTFVRSMSSRTGTCSDSLLDDYFMTFSSMGVSGADLLRSEICSITCSSYPQVEAYFLISNPLDTFEHNQRMLWILALNASYDIRAPTA